MRVKIIFFIAFLVLSSCNNKKEETKKDSNVTEINFSKLEYKKFPIPDKKMKFVPLETTEEGLVGDIEKIEIRDSLFFIFDKNRNLLVFNFEGKFQNKIGQVGQGPNELRHLTHFYVDTERKQVGIFDLFRKTVFYYDYNGELQDKLNVAGVLTEDVNKIYFSNNLLLASMRRWKENNNIEFNFKVYSIADSCAEISSLFPFKFKSDINESIGWSQVAKNSAGVLFSPLLTDSIYTLTNDGKAVPKYVFKSNLKSCDEFLEYGEFKETDVLYKKLRKEGYSLGVYSLYATDTYLHFTFDNYVSDKYYHIIYNLKEDKGYYTEDPVLPFSIPSGPIYTSYKEKFVTAIPAPALKLIQSHDSYAIRGNKDLDKIMSTLTDEDNPIIVLYELD